MSSQLEEVQRQLDTAAEKPVSEKSERKSAATILVEMANEAYTFGISTVGEAFAIPKSGPNIVSLMRGSKTSLRNELARAYFRQHRRAAPQQALADALMVIEGMAQEGEQSDLHLRAYRDDGAFWLDLGDPTGKVVCITVNGWTIEDRAPVLFKRTVLNGPLPLPEKGGSLADLWYFLNVTEADRPLLAAWLVSGLIHNIPHPVLTFLGEQGTGKTTTQKMLVNTIDPGPVPTRKPPRDPDSWITAAAGSWVVGLDNLSDVQPWLSDSICRAVTGDGDVRRKLYTDGEHAVFAFRRCVCLNSIHLGAIRGDLAERMLPVTLEPIPDSRRMTEEEVWGQWAERHPRILGAVLELTASVARRLPSLRLNSKPRMADFARILAAVDQKLGTNGLQHYLQKQDELAADSLTVSAFMLKLMAHGSFIGTSADLLARLAPDRPPKGWPANAASVTALLRRNSPALRKLGWVVEDDDGRNKGHVIHWTLTSPPDQPEKVCNPSSPSSPTRPNGEIGEQTSKASPRYGLSQADGAASWERF